MLGVALLGSLIGYRASFTSGLHIAMALAGTRRFCSASPSPTSPSTASPAQRKPRAVAFASCWSRAMLLILEHPAGYRLVVVEGTGTVM